MPVSQWLVVESTRVAFVPQRECVCARRRETAIRTRWMPLWIPERPWSTIGVDFIVKLPLSDSFDSMMVIVDNYLKSTHFIKVCQNWSSTDLANAFVDRFFRLHGLPDKHRQHIYLGWKNTRYSRIWNLGQNLSRFRSEIILIAKKYLG